MPSEVEAIISVLMLKRILIPKSLSARLTLTLWTVSLVSVLGAGLLTAVLIRWRVEEDVQAQLTKSTQRLVVLGLSTLNSNSERNLYAVIIKNLLSVSRADRIMRIFDAQGKLLYSSFPTEELGFLDSALRIHLEAVAREELEHDPVVTTGEQGSFVSVIQAYRNASGERRLIQVAQAIPRFRETLKESGTPYALVLMLLLLCSLAASFYLSNRLIRPIRKVADHLRQLDRSDVRSWRPIPETYDRAFLEEIIQSANDLIGRVQNAFFANHNLARFVAHEVRTPLTMMLGEIEVAKRIPPDSEDLKRMIDTFSQDIIKMDRIISTILEIAQRDRESNPYHPQSIELQVMINQLAQDFRDTYRRFITVTVGENLPSYISIDPELMRLLVDNLLRNSVKHSQSPTTRHELKVFQEDPRTIILQIIDSGPGIDDEIASALNKREAPAKRLGVGLSLALEISKIASWRLKFHNLNPGLCVSVAIPLMMNGEKEVDEGKVRGLSDSNARPSGSKPDALSS